MALRIIRLLCAAVFVGGIVGMIVSSVRGNNNGWVISFGIATAIASLVMLAVAAALPSPRIDVFEEADAEALEQEISRVVQSGADETAVRTLVRDALRVARRR